MPGCAHLWQKWCGGMSLNARSLGTHVCAWLQEQGVPGYAHLWQDVV